MNELPENLRIFPLPGVVLFPGTVLPLHVFEPRYRKLLAHALDSDRVIGMTLLRGSESESGEPEVYATGCAGSIVAHEPLSDGRSLVVVRGDLRFRIIDEPVSNEPYRIVHAQALHEVDVRIDGHQGWREELRSRIDDSMVPRDEREQIEGLFRKAGAEGLINQLCAVLPLDVLEKQSLLECATLDERCELLKRVLDFKRAELRLGMNADRLADA